MTALVSPGPTYSRPWLYPAQEAAIFSPARYAIVEASTKSGKSAGCLVWLLEQAMRGEAGRTYWWIAPVYSQAKIVYRRMKRAIPRDLYTANETELTVTLINGAVIFFKSAENPDNLYGEDVWAAVLDEACRIKEPAWHAVRSTLTATGGPVRMIGNVRGRSNWHYKLARRAESGERGYSYARLTAYDAVEGGVLPLAEVEDAKRVLPEVVFNELYLAIPSDMGSNPFGLQAIEECVREQSALPATACGLDLARGKAPGSDWTVLTGLDASRTVCAFDRFQAPWAQQILRIRSTAGHAPTLVDATGVGDPVLEELQQGGGAYEGYVFSSRSKQALMEGLAISIGLRELHFPPGPIVSELSEFEYSYTATGVRYSAPEGLHDDCVVSLGLANHHFRSGGPRVRFL